MKQARTAQTGRGRHVRLCLFCRQIRADIIYSGVRRWNSLSLWLLRSTPWQSQLLGRLKDKKVRFFRWISPFLTWVLVITPYVWVLSIVGVHSFELLEFHFGSCRFWQGVDPPPPLRWRRRRIHRHHRITGFTRITHRTRNRLPSLPLLSRAPTRASAELTPWVLPPFLDYGCAWFGFDAFRCQSLVLDSCISRNSFVWFVGLSRRGRKEEVCRQLIVSVSILTVFHFEVDGSAVELHVMLMMIRLVCALLYVCRLMTCFPAWKSRGWDSFTLKGLILVMPIFIFCIMPACFTVLSQLCDGIN